MSATERRKKRFLSAEQKYDLWVRMLTGQLTTVQAAAEAGVDRSTIMTLKRVARRHPRSHSTRIPAPLTAPATR